MSMLGTKQPTSYKDGRTKQAFKDETDINKILQRAEKTGTISHINKYEGAYSDFSNYDYVENLIKLTRGREIFDDLPAELRNEFSNSPAKFFDYVNEPKNKDRLAELLPALAAPGRQMLSATGNIKADEAKALKEREKKETATEGKTPAEKPPEAAPKAPKEPSSDTT